MGWFPFFKQKKEYTCGPASLRMVLEFFGKNFTEEKIAKLSHTREDKGTSHIGLINAARKAGFYCYVHEDSSISHIQHFINKGYPVIVNYIEPNSKIGHYGIVIGYSKDKLMLNDSSDGEEFSIHKGKFESLWYGEDKWSRKWLLVISKKKFNIGKQYFPK